MNETYRPVKLNKVVMGYYCSPKTSDYCFDLTLNYKLATVIKDYSESKPTLIVHFIFLVNKIKFDFIY